MSHSYLEEAQAAWKRLSADDRLREEARVREGTMAALAAARGEGHEEGLEQGLREMLLLVLEARGFAITNDLRRRVAECGNPTQLKEWARVAATAMSIEDVFDI